MRCERHSWDNIDAEWCWRCEELTIQENKQKYEDKLRDNGLQRIGGDKKIGSISTEAQEPPRRDCNSL